MFKNLKIDLKNNQLKVQLHKKSNNNFKNSDIFIKKVLKSFESTRRSIKNNIYHNETTTFDEHSRDHNNIKSVYKSFQSARLQSKKKI